MRIKEQPEHETYEALPKGYVIIYPCSFDEIESEADVLECDHIAGRWTSKLSRDIAIFAAKVGSKTLHSYYKREGYEYVPRESWSSDLTSDDGHYRVIHSNREGITVKTILAGCSLIPLLRGLADSSISTDKVLDVYKKA